MSQLAPIALFAYRRVSHLERTLDALEKCPEFSRSPVFIFSDGPKSSESEKPVTEVRNLIKSRLRSNMTLIENEHNQGLANSIISGVTQLCGKYGRVIVIEDDLILQPCALEWFNDALEKYESDPLVMHIGAYQYHVPDYVDLRTGVFQRFVTSWGWATWARAWSNFDPEATGWRELQRDRDLQRAFDIQDAYPYTPMIEAQMAGRIDSWAIRWWWSVFRAGGVSLMPPRSLVDNVGFDSTATHNTVGALKRWVSGPRPHPWPYAERPALPDSTKCDSRNTAAFRRALIRTNAMRNYRIKRHLAAIGLKRFDR